MTETAAIRQNFENIEEAYEFMLAYAAQGRADEGGGADGAHIRDFIGRFVAAAEVLVGQIADVIAEDGDVGAAMLAAFRQDSATILSVLRLVLARDSISSEIVDNTNGLISMRAYLTSLFFIDKVVIAD